MRNAVLRLKQDSVLLGECMVTAGEGLNPFTRFLNMGAQCL